MTTWILNLLFYRTFKQADKQWEQQIRDHLHADAVMQSQQVANRVN